MLKTSNVKLLKKDMEGGREGGSEEGKRGKESEEAIIIISNNFF